MESLFESFIQALMRQVRGPVGDTVTSFFGRI